MRMVSLRATSAWGRQMKDVVEKEIGPEMSESYSRAVSRLGGGAAGKGF